MGILNTKQLEQRLHQQIPLSQFMQVQVIKADDTEIELQSDLNPNHNHLGTAFGGSLSCLMILAAYCQIFRIINESGHVILRSSSMDFLLPVEQTLRAICKSPSEESVQNFLKVYNKKGKARLSLESQIILDDGRVACTMTAEFVGVN
jgi:thioesterase domain-containing protein